MNKQNSFSNKTIEALKMAIEALEDSLTKQDVAINTCKEALAEAENPELVAVQYLYRADPDNPEMIPLYTHPATWQSLNDGEMKELLGINCSIYDIGFYDELDLSDVVELLKKHEQALKDKNKF